MYSNRGSLNPLPISAILSPLMTSLHSDSSLSASLALPQCPKLDDANFTIWKARISDALKVRKWWKWVIGTAVKPQLDTTAEDKVKASKEWKKSDEEYEETDQAVAAFIRQYISDSQLHHVSSCTSAAETWTKICSAHEKRGMNTALQYISIIMTAKLAPGGNVQEHINTLRNANERLKAAGLNIEFNDKLLGALLMYSLDSSYEPIKMVLSTYKEVDFTFAAVCSAIINEEARRKTASGSNNSSGGSEPAALYTQTQQQQPSHPRPERCGWCSKRGHTEDDCWRKADGKSRVGKNKRKTQQQQQNSGHTASSSSNSSSSDKQAQHTESHDDGHIYHVLTCDDESDEEEGGDKALSVSVGNAIAAVTSSTPLSRGTSQSVSLHSRPPKQVGANKVTWYVDSGASFHYCNNREWFDRFEPVSGQHVRLGDGRRVSLMGAGSLKVSVPISNTRSVGGMFINVQYVPDLTANLLSVAAMTECGLIVTFEKEKCTIRNRQQQIVGIATRVSNKLYELIVTHSNSPATALAVTQMESADTLKLWHERLGHCNMASVRQLFTHRMVEDAEGLGENLPLNLTVADDHTDGHCTACHLGKAHRLPFATAVTTRSTAPLQLVHIDVWGPYRTPTAGGARYYLVVVDDYSRFVWLRLMKGKGEATKYIKEFKEWAETVHSDNGLRLKEVRMDQGKEFQSTELKTFFTENGITIQLTAGHSPQQNGVAERANRTIVETVRTMMHSWSPMVPIQFWGEATQAAVYLRNRCPTRSVKGKTPYEVWYGKKPNIGHLRTYGCLAYMHVPKEHRNAVGQLGKMAPKASRCALVGYSPDSKTYRLWDTGRGKLVTSRDVVFAENLPGFSHEHLPQVPLSQESPSSSTETASITDFSQAPEMVLLPLLAEESEQSQPVSAPSSPLPAPPASLSSMPEPGPLPAAAPTSVPVSAKLPRELRLLQDRLSPGVKDHAPSAVSNKALRVTAVSDIPVAMSAADPLTVNEALQRPDADKWRAAMDAELSSLRKAGTYELVPLPTDRNAIPSKWVFKTKRGADGLIKKYKARLVAQGCRQEYGVDYVETFAPVARLSSIRAVLALVAHHDWELHQMDVRSAYLNGDLDEEIYMKQPTGYVEEGKESCVCRLKKGLYGLKQAGRLWNKKIDTVLKGMGFAALPADNCVYVYRRENTIVLLSLYVDDLLIASDSLTKVIKIKEELSAAFEMEDLGEAHFVLGIEITRDRKARTLSISQGAYISNVLDKFNLAASHPVRTPMVTGPHMDKSTDKDALDPHQTKNYQAAVGALMYAAQCTRPDISFAVSALSQYCSRPNQEHYTAVKRVLRYLRGTTHHGITYHGKDATTIQSQDHPILHGYCDSDYANDRADRRSYTGYAFYLGDAVVSWQSRKQTTVTLSSTEAEYMAASEAVKEALWWRSFMHSLGLGYDQQATCIRSDNQGSICLTKNAGSHSRTKHIDVRHFFIRDEVEKGAITFEYVPTAKMAADVLTKALSEEKHKATTQLLGMTDVSSL